MKERTGWITRLLGGATWKERSKGRRKQVPAKRKAARLRQKAARRENRHE